jgi:hypothetical protein
VALVEAVRVELDASVSRLYQLYDDAERRTLHDLLARIVDTANREPDALAAERR